MATRKCDVPRSRTGSGARMLVSESPLLGRLPWLTMLPRLTEPAARRALLARRRAPALRRLARLAVPAGLTRLTRLAVAARLTRLREAPARRLREPAAGRVGAA